ncbi:MAG: PepSY domain-containing protein [Actinobacteria bacterium]|nr:PepSY domain-containing protein [Actinomycetota bacterium]
MTRKLALIIAVVLALAALSAGIAIAGGVGGGGDEKPLAGATLAKATAAALEHTGGGTVTETETGDDGAAYGVEVRLANGDQVEVNLDERFQVIGQEADDDGAGGEDGANDDD